MRITRDQAMMSHAIVTSNRSTCSRAMVGCVIARDYRIISMGYNGSPKGLEHCRHLDDSPCLDAVHAEVNAIAFAAREGISTDGCDLYTTISPCRACCQLIINSGIGRVFYQKQHRETTGIILLRKAGIEVIHYQERRK